MQQGSFRKTIIYLGCQNPTTSTQHSLHNLTHDNMESITRELTTLLDKVPKPALATFGAVGAYFVLKKALSFLNIFFSLLVLPGKDVNSPSPRSITLTYTLTSNSYESMGLRAAGL